MRRWKAPPPYSDRPSRRSLHHSRERERAYPSWRHKKSREASPRHIRHHTGYKYFVDWRKQHRSSHEHRRPPPHYRSKRKEKEHYKPLFERQDSWQYPRATTCKLPLQTPRTPRTPRTPKARPPLYPPPTIPARRPPSVRKQQSPSFSSSQRKSEESGQNYREVNEAVFLSDDPKKDRSKDAGHFEWTKNELLGDKYKVIRHLGDGTFGRCLECLNAQDRRYYAVKVIRSVERYLEAAKDQVKILEKLKSFDKLGTARIAYLKDSFSFKKKKAPHLAMVFERLGPSVYDVIKSNHYYGLPIEKIRSYARDLLEALAFLHSHHLTHTDLKPENILLDKTGCRTLPSDQIPLVSLIHEQQSYKKLKGSPRPSPLKNISGKCEEAEQLEAFPQNTNYPFNYYRSPQADHVKIIDFGGATFEQNYHSTTINTRQYRAPEVILRCQRWNEKSDIWSAACVIIEMYTGELFFPTHQNYEHLAMMEAQLGPIPLAMVLECHQTLKGFFNIDLREKEIQKKGHRVNWPRFCKNDESYEAVKNFLRLKTLIHEDHGDLLELLEYMFKFDPRVRPSAEECLMQRFFNPRKSIALPSTASHSKSKH